MTKNSSLTTHKSDVLHVMLDVFACLPVHLECTHPQQQGKACILNHFQLTSIKWVRNPKETILLLVAACGRLINLCHEYNYAVAEKND